jgi:plasmid stability protein
MVPKWRYTSAMPVSLSIKGVPDDLARALRRRAGENHRSVQGELMHILESAVRPRAFRAEEFVRRVQAVGVRTPGDGTAIIRRNRDLR